MADRNLEKLEVLDGSRAGGLDVKKRAAVRVKDLAAITEIATKLKSSKAAGDPPTKAEFDALWEDLNDIHRRLVAMARDLTARLV